MHVGGLHRSIDLSAPNRRVTVLGGRTRLPCGHHGHGRDPQKSGVKWRLWRGSREQPNWWESSGLATARDRQVVLYRVHASTIQLKITTSVKARVVSDSARTTEQE